MKLYNYHASSASYRVRIALGLKGLSYEYIPVKLGWDNNEHETDAFRRINPQIKLPVLVHDGNVIGQSIAIIEYLDEVYPDPPLVPRDRAARARVRHLALFVACEIQPLNNMRVERHLHKEMGVDKERLRDWRRYWMRVGFDSLEEELVIAPETGRYCHGDEPTMADIFLIPQVANALLPGAEMDLSAWPTVRRIYETCLEHPAFEAARPANQPDAPRPVAT